jgi:uncharacterized protein YegL
MNEQKTLITGVLLTLLLLATIPIQSETLVAAQDPPHLEVNSSVSPSEVKLREVGSASEKTQITLTINGAGEPVREDLPVDVILIIDRSTSMTGQKLEDAISAANILINLLNPAKDRLGLIFFASTATLDIDLTSNPSSARAALSDLNATGFTATADAIQMATEELCSKGRHNAVWMEILLSDGATSESSDPVIRSKEAAEANITIHTIGIRPPNEDSVSTLNRLANVTGGKYYSTPNPYDLEEIYTLTQPTINLAGGNIVVKEVLQEYIQLEGNFSVKPSHVDSNPDGTTTLTWRVSDLSIGDTWTVSFNVTSNRNGNVPVDVPKATLVTYNNFMGTFATVNFPETKLQVKLNQPPIANAGPDQTVRQTRLQGAWVILDGSGSYDLDGDNLKYTWKWKGKSVSGTKPWVELLLGETIVTLTVNDGMASASDEVKITIIEASLTPQEARGIEGLFKYKFIPFYFFASKEILTLLVLLLLVALLVLATRGQERYSRYSKEYERLRSQLWLNRILVKFLYVLLIVLFITLFIIPLFT